MNKNYTFKDCYQILSLNADCSWSDLRKSYKKSIQKWHPDRYKDGSKEKEVAVIKVKAINTAYKQIHKYYRREGTLPPVEETTRTIPTQKNTTSKTTDPAKAQTNSAGFKAKKNTAVSKNTAKTPVISSIILVIGIVALYYFFTDSFYLEDAERTRSIKHSNHSAASSTDNKSIQSPVISKKQLQDKLALEISDENSQSDKNTPGKNELIDKFFTSGSTIADVIFIQGAPTKTEGDVWFYGNSEVHFKDGEVSYWVRSAKTPLKARMTIHSADKLSSFKKQTTTISK